jgi:hypothetical protein
MKALLLFITLSLASIASGQSVSLMLPLGPSIDYTGQRGIFYNAGVSAEVFGFGGNLYVDGRWNVGYVFSERSGNACSESLTNHQFGIFAGPDNIEFTAAFSGDPMIFGMYLNIGTSSIATNFGMRIGVNLFK